MAEVGAGARRAAAVASPSPGAAEAAAGASVEQRPEEVIEEAEWPTPGSNREEAAFPTPNELKENCRPSSIELRSPNIEHLHLKKKAGLK